MNKVILSQVSVPVTPAGVAAGAVGVAAGAVGVAAKQRVYICHISHREAKLSIFAGMVKVKQTQPEQTGGGRRGLISGFSAAARKRMLEFLAKLRGLPNKSAFVTLTYPSIYPDAPAEWKRHLDTFFKALRRLRGADGCFAVWRIEAQKRGAPHFHLLIFGYPSGLQRFRKWVAARWYQIVASGDQRHFYAGTQVNKITSRHHACAYAAKYAAKIEGCGNRFATIDGEIVELVGKHWGVFNRAAADTSEFAEYDLDWSDVVGLRRVVSRWLKSKGNHYANRLARGKSHLGFSVFGLGDDIETDFIGGRRTIMRMLAALDV